MEKSQFEVTTQNEKHNPIWQKSRGRDNKWKKTAGTSHTMGFGQHHKIMGFLVLSFILRSWVVPNSHIMKFEYSENWIYLLWE